MDDKTLFLLSLFFALAGILVLFLLAQTLAPTEVPLESVSSEDVGKLVLVKGTVRSFFKGQSFYSFNLCLSRCLKIVDFKQKYLVQNGNFAAVEGKVAEFKGELEVIADSVEVLGGGR